MTNVIARAIGAPPLLGLRRRQFLTRKGAQHCKSPTDKRALGDRPRTCFSRFFLLYTHQGP